MEREIKWTKRAQSNFDNTVQYLEREWGVYSAKKFVRKVQNLLFQLKKQPKIGKAEITGKDIRSFVFSRHNTIFYRITENSIIVLAIFDNRRGPKDRPV